MIRRILQVFLITIVCVVMVEACKEKASITFSVQVDSGDITGAKITLTNNNEKKSQIYSKIVANATVVFEQIEQGTYRLDIFHEDYWLYKQEDIAVNMADSVHIINMEKILIYDIGPDYEEWRYLMVAPADTEIKANWNEARNKIKELNIEGFTDWRLPDREQLNILFQNFHRHGLGDFQNERYWSSKKDVSNYVWDQDFANGSQGANFNSSEYFVRAIRVYE